MHKIFFILGFVFTILGVLFYFGKGIGLGKLPGDISIKSENAQFHFPIVTCLIISAVLSGVMWLINYFNK